MLSEKYSGMEPGYEGKLFSTFEGLLDFQSKVLEGYLPGHSVYHFISFKAIPLYHAGWYY